MTHCILLVFALVVFGSGVASAQAVPGLRPHLHPIRPGKEEPAQGKIVTSAKDYFGKSAGEGRELVPGVKFRWCPAGDFRMGSTDHETAVKVTLTQGFWLCETEVTQGQFQSLMKSEPWKGKALVKEGSEYPATYVGYPNAVAYSQNLTARERAGGRLPLDWKYVLPTEAQWEYACRSGTGTKYSFAADASRLGDYAWFDKNAWDIGAKYAHAVGQKRSNDWGLKDMHGNVWEWCSDWYGDTLPGGRDPQGASSGSVRVIRGGGFGNDASYCRSVSRFWFAPDDRDYFVGFRVAAVPTVE